MADTRPTTKARKLPRIRSDFALLDVQSGRNALTKALATEDAVPIPVTITGYLTQAWGDDDGTSREFGMKVTQVKYGHE